MKESKGERKGVDEIVSYSQKIRFRVQQEGASNECGSRPNCSRDQNKFLRILSLSVFNIRSVANTLEFSSSDAV